MYLLGPFWLAFNGKSTGHCCLLGVLEDRILSNPIQLFLDPTEIAVAFLGYNNGPSISFLLRCRSVGPSLLSGVMLFSVTRAAFAQELRLQAMWLYAEPPCAGSYAEALGMNLGMVWIEQGLGDRLGPEV